MIVYRKEAKKDLGFARPSDFRRYLDFLLKSQSGQAFVEYTLILVVTVAIIGGVLFQFSSGFRAFTQAYFGSYVKCLLEVGELPGLGGGGVSGICADQMPNYKALAAAASGQAGANGSGQNSGSDSTKKGKTPPQNSSSSGRSGTRGVNRGDTPNNGDIAGAFNSAGRPSKKTVASSATAGDGEFKSTPIDRAAGKTFGRDLTPAGGLGRKPLDRGFADDSETRRLEEKNQPKKVADQSTDRLKPKIVEVTDKRKPSSEGDNEDKTDWSFSSVFRWLFIAGILVALLVFLGGQVAQISKGREK
jgi:Flp pilus assembly pilin Flp